MEVWPPIVLPLGEKESVIEEDLERTDLRVDDVLVSVGVDVLILCNFERDEVSRHHITDNLQGRVSFCDHFCD